MTVPCWTAARRPPGSCSSGCKDPAREGSLRHGESSFNRLGTAVGNVGLFMSLTTMNILLFYFEQFSTIITAAIQFLLIAGLLVYRRAGPL